MATPLPVTVTSVRVMILSPILPERFAVTLLAVVICVSTVV